ncbi:hypothetical protein JX265_000317 [Neoarthrinium moseri]|uniref:CENP-V/GFA domain-containing protein n=1 Tax=Neoarthrinium moseri TaxID=1658444 RepID=A0A9Q0AVG1_9PEZI|nr:uncharacterized protein JN550_000567 [Neoarthrinium moseri]KAI1842639.1 hypothetical protein JX266_011101 [Neoarthrinium moseri]KAI1878385.1 hypothetical protein JN550_000567 [Neoarthrinium moseri]KAI1881491.1 hypothetical protein JX265_000317 [Neoarthrinium moseri]
MATPSLNDFPKPTSITGGCLCGAIRYKVDFPAEHDFLKASTSCQCTQCRRNTGTLVLFSHAVLSTAVTYLTPTTTLKNFNASPGIQRGFCVECGSFVYWRDESQEEVYMTIGCIDPEYLMGEEGKTEGFGFALVNGSGDNVFCENELKGVREGWVGKTGKRWQKGTSYGVLMP